MSKSLSDLCRLREEAKFYASDTTTIIRELLPGDDVFTSGTNSSHKSLDVGSDHQQATPSTRVE